MATYLADRVIVYDGTPSVECTANTYVFFFCIFFIFFNEFLFNRPQDLLSGMNTFLKSLNITFRRDPTNYRPRINQLNSQKDSEQKAAGNYFFMDS